MYEPLWCAFLPQQFRVQFLGQLAHMAVVYTNVHQGHSVVRKSLFHYLLDLRRVADPETLGSESLCELYKVYASELDATTPAVLHDFLELDHLQA